MLSQPGEKCQDRVFPNLKKTLQWLQVFIIKQQSAEVKNNQQSVPSPVTDLHRSSASVNQRSDKFIKM